MTKKRRAAAMFLACLAFMIFCGFPFQQAHAVAVIDDALALIIIAALAGMGITFTMSGGIRTVISWLNDVIAESGLSFSGIRYGANNQGQILLNNRFLTVISSLALYIQYELGLTDNSTTVISESGTIAGSVYAYRLPIQFDSNDGSRYVMFSSAPDAYVFFCKSNSSGTHVRAIAFTYGENPFTLYKYVSFGNSSYTINSSAAVGGYYAHDNNYINIDGAGSSYSNEFNGIVVYPEQISQTEVRGFLEQNVFGSAISNTQDLSAVTGTIDIPSGTDIDGMGGILTIPADWGDSLPGLLTSIPTLVLDDELAGNTDLDLAPEADVADQVNVEATTQEIVSSEPSDYAVTGLRDVFPFCIPFDLYAFLECLDAEPEAPAFTWRIYVPNVADEEVEVDLSEFETLAQIIRIMELLLFCVGLAFVTRKLIRG